MGMRDREENPPDEADLLALLDQMTRRDRRLFACDIGESVLTYYSEDRVKRETLDWLIKVARACAQRNSSFDPDLAALAGTYGMAWHSLNHPGNRLVMLTVTQVLSLDSIIAARGAVEWALNTVRKLENRPEEVALFQRWMERQAALYAKQKGL